MRACCTALRLSIRRVKSVMGLLPRKCPSMMAVSSAKPWRIVAADSERPNERRGWKPCPRFRSRNLGMSLMWRFLKYNVLSRSGQNGLARRCVAPRISELQKWTSEQDGLSRPS